jgi:hypothetical protein
VSAISRSWDDADIGQPGFGFDLVIGCAQIQG